MATNLTTIFGDEICVVAQPRHSDRQYVGFAGAHGLVGMHLGTRGRQLVITGKLASSGESYSAARINVQATIDAIEAYLWTDAADYSFEGTTYSNVVFDKFQLLADSKGKAFHWTADGYVTVDFIMYGRILI